MPQIQAAVLRRGGLLAIETLELEGPRPDEVLVRLAATGICHTDLSFMEGWSGPPVVLGHEGAGVVLEAGQDLKAVRPGDHVVLSYQSCGRCGPCRQGRPTACQHFWELNFGFGRLDDSNALAASGVRGHFFGQSSFATHCLASERNLVKVSPDLPLELLAPLGCGLQTGAGTVLNSLKVPPGASLAVFGTGAVGLAAVMAAQLTGADPVIGVDLNAARLKLALTLGATRVIDSRREEVISEIKTITGGGVDYVLETTGDPKMHQLGVEILNPRGTLALIAHPGGGGPLPGGRRALGIIQGDAVPQTFIPRLIALHQAGQFPYERLLKYYDFAQIHRAVAEARRGEAIKPVLRFS
jgi:aryl-alcohol dehydrogenase